MLTDIQFDPTVPVILPEQQMDPIYNDLSDEFKSLTKGDILVRLAEGIYKYWSSNAIIIPGYDFVDFEEVPERAFNGMMSYDYFPYGVCDNYQQVLDRVPEVKKYIDDPDNQYIIQLSPVVKKGQPSRQGWRWERWGDYIGDQKSYAEYLYDEPEIEIVYVYQIYKVIKKQ